MVLEEFGDTTQGRVAFEIRFSVLRDRDGQPIGAAQTAYDVSARLQGQAELEQAREALRQSQKMEAMGQLTGGVAHDFNNLLTPILGSLDRLQRKGVGDERDRRMIEGAIQSAERAATLVQRLLAFARRQPLLATAVDVGALVQGMAELVASTSGPRVRVVLDLQPDLSPALADANQVEMALLNLAVNARDAMPDGGALTIAAAEEEVGAGHRSKLTPGRYVCLAVSDTGTGMTPEVLARAIEPFFSTKGVGKGTGLGLSMVHGLAAQLGGALAVASQPGLGTNVELWLPIGDGAAMQAKHPSTSTAAAGAGTVLLVDDEEVVRTSTAEMLADLGYRVVEARSAEAALQLVHEGLAPDLLVTDHLMPGMTGVELAREVRALRPGTPVLVVSGYADMEGMAPDLPRLTKPFRQAGLAASLAAVSAGISG
jgi:signal transduction histidine kinase/CheY-like chemotaxis protein